MVDREPTEAKKAAREAAKELHATYCDDAQHDKLDCPGEIEMDSCRLLRHMQPVIDAARAEGCKPLERVLALAAKRDHEWDGEGGCYDEPRLQDCPRCMIEKAASV